VIRKLSKNTNRQTIDFDFDFDIDINIDRLVEKKNNKSQYDQGPTSPLLLLTNGQQNKMCCRSEHKGSEKEKLAFFMLFELSFRSIYLSAAAGSEG